MKKIMTTFHFTFFALATFAPLTGCANNPNAIITVRVIDDAGKPISNVQSRIMSTFSYGTPTGLTDTNGMYAVHLDKIYDLDGTFQKHGYYKTSGEFWQAPQWGDVPPADTNFIVVLKRIIEPISMKQRELIAIFPRLDEPIGYDLEIGDWIFPDGKGEITDILLKAERQYVSANDYSVNLFAKFAGEHNGIQPFYVHRQSANEFYRSELRTPPIAPLTGYINTYERFARQLPTEKKSNFSYDRTIGWIFRIRTELDENGEIITANYGWFSEDFSVGPIANGTARTSFKFYFNSDPKSRSLEPKEIADRQNKVSPFKGK